MTHTSYYTPRPHEWQDVNKRQQKKSITAHPWSFIKDFFPVCRKCVDQLDLMKTVDPETGSVRTRALCYVCKTGVNNPTRYRDQFLVPKTYLAPLLLLDQTEQDLINRV